MAVDLQQILREQGSLRRAAAHLTELGIPTTKDSLRRRLSKLSSKPSDDEIPFDVPERPDGEVPFEELYRRRTQDYARRRKARERRDRTPVKVKLDGPIGLACQGDPHVDDDGTDIELLFAHAKVLAETEGMLVGCIGDVRNNWCGRLERLYGQQTTSAKEALTLTKAYVNMVPWLFMIGGNHDIWSGVDDPLEWLLSAGPSVYQPHETKLTLKLPRGREILIHAAHDFPGRSQYNPAFGPAKKALWDATSHIYLAGHIHQCGYQFGWNDSRKLMWHAVRIGSYKQYDRYAVELGFDFNGNIVCPVALINPEATNPVNLIRWEWDPLEGAERLTWMRRRWAAGKSLDG